MCFGDVLLYYVGYNGEEMFPVGVQVHTLGVLKLWCAEVILDGSLEVVPDGVTVAIYCFLGHEMGLVEMVRETGM